MWATVLPELTALTPAAILLRLGLLRLFAASVQTALIIWVHWGLQLKLPLLPMLSVPLLLILLDGLLWLRLRRAATVSEWEIFLHLLVDTMALVVLLFYSGGASNPFASLLLLPIVISAAVLSARYTWRLTVLALLAYTVLMRYALPLPLPVEGGMTAAFALHVLGMWLNFIGSALLVALFITHLAAVTRAQAQRLVAAQQTALRQEQVVMLGALAAGAAHELSTPLTSIRLIANELAEALRDDPDYGREVQLLREQTERCKHILSQLTLQGGVPRGEALQVEPVTPTLTRLVQDWQQQHPQVSLQFDLPSGPSPALCFWVPLRQALLSTLQNAADVGPAVRLQVSWDVQNLTFIIMDQGPALEVQQITALGQPFFSTKQEGVGLGCYLAQTTVQQLGGQWQFLPSTGAGSTVTLSVPLARLRPETGEHPA